LAKKPGVTSADTPKVPQDQILIFHLPRILMFSHLFRQFARRFLADRKFIHLSEYFHLTLSCSSRYFTPSCPAQISKVFHQVASPQSPTSPPLSINCARRTYISMQHTHGFQILVSALRKLNEVRIMSGQFVHVHARGREWIDVHQVCSWILLLREMF
jgi:hypothetical protein